MTVQSPNTELLRRIAEHLGPLAEQVVFVGGTTTALLLTDPAAAHVRLTDDVDVLAGTRSLADYYAFASELRRRGFKEDEGGPVCRWVIDDLRLDVMPPDPQLLGFSNRWYEEALSRFTVEIVGPGVSVRVITAPYFLATKLEAFHGRGRGDVLASHDLEDIITVVNGRVEIVEEVRTAASPGVQRYLSEELTVLLGSDQFDRAVSGHLQPDTTNQARTAIVVERLEAIAAIAGK